LVASPLDPHRENTLLVARESPPKGRRLVFAKDSGLLQGTLELLVLKTLSWGPMHGYGIASWIESATGDVLSVEEGSLYPALYRMTRKGWIKGEWGVSENNRRAKYYHLTGEGRKQFTVQASGWQRMAAAVSEAIGATQAPSWAR
jgi:PadR family transcriptional regulator, regulatory protein PadR